RVSRNLAFIEVRRENRKASPRETISDPSYVLGKPPPLMHKDQAGTLRAILYTREIPFYLLLTRHQLHHLAFSLPFSIHPLLPPSPVHSIAIESILNPKVETLSDSVLLRA